MAADNTTTAAKSTPKELDDKDSRRITITMKNQIGKSVAQVEHPPERLPQLDGDEDDNVNNEGDDKKEITEEEKISCIKIMELMDQAKRERADIKKLLSS